MIYETCKFNAAFTRALQQSLSWAESIQLLVFIPISLRSILMSSSQHLGFSKFLFPIGLPIKSLNPFLPSFLHSGIWPAHLSLIVLSTLTILDEQYKLWSSLLWSLLHSQFSSLLGPNIRLRILFSNTLSLHQHLYCFQ